MSATHYKFGKEKQLAICSFSDVLKFQQVIEDSPESLEKICVSDSYR
jgi:hypothetical protein